MKIYYYSGTHWDREWYQTFQGFRKRLVDAMDTLIEVLETAEDYGVFHMDGQTIVLEDYLEIRPEMKERLTRLIQAGKIVIGPWYNMPDEFLLSGESIIKNLRRGKEICKEYGVEPCRNAYICDIFGHSSQTPQIFAGMGYRHTILGRGTNQHTEPAHLLWEALDGTRICAFKLADEMGYGDFTTFLKSHDINTMPAAEFDAALKAYVDSEIARSDVPVVMLMDALDHIPIRPDTPKYLAALRRLYPQAEVYHCSVEEFIRQQDLYRDSLPVRRGELCRPAKSNSGYNKVITNTLSARYPLKAYNDKNQTRLEKWVAPLYAFRQTRLSPGFLRVADKYLMQNHPHDSICGCSIDQVHKDMMYRFDQTALICDEVMNELTVTLRDQGTDTSREGVCLRLFNPLPYRLTKTVTAVVTVDSLPCYQEPFGYEDVPAFRLYDDKDKEIPYGFVRRVDKKQIEIAFEAELLPDGITEYALRPSAMPTRNPARLLTSPLSARGDYAAVSVNPDGTVNLTDLTTGEVYANLLTLVDDGEIGDGWFHCNPLIDTVVTATAVDVAVTENSAVRTTFRITQKLAMPARVEEDGTRSAKTVDYKVVHYVTLAKGERGITVHTVIDNNAEDHRLRLRLPAVVEGDTYEAAQAFGYVTRTCGDDPTTADWHEYGAAERNMAGICAKRKGNRGLAFVSAYGLHECGVWQNGDMDVTLMRCFGKTVNNSGDPGGFPHEPGCQLKERLEYDYRILPFGETMLFADLQKEQDVLSTGLLTVTVNGGTAHRYPTAFEVAGDGIIYSTANLLPDGDGEIRLFNDTDRQRTATVTMPIGTKNASLMELDGRHLCDLPLSDRQVQFDLPAFRIATIRFHAE